MGYTHYWRNAKEATPAFITDVRKVLAFAKVPLVREYDEPATEPEVVEAASESQRGEAMRRLDGPVPGVRFNGVGDDGHETFLFPGDRTDTRGEGSFAFCKTARKPYDIVVTAILALVAEHKLAIVESDGDREDWQAGVTLASQATGREISNPIADED